MPKVCTTILMLTMCVTGWAVAPGAAAFGAQRADLRAELAPTVGESKPRLAGKSAAATRAQARHGGKVLSVTKGQRQGKTVYKVKLLLDSGRIKIVTVQG